MFDVSFSELILIGVVALVVIGPERLPKVARTVGHLLGRAQRYVNDVKSDIQREMEDHNLGDLKGQIEDAAKSVKASVEDAGNTIRDPLAQAQEALKNANEAVHGSFKLDGAAAAEPASDASSQEPAHENAASADPHTLPLPGFDGTAPEPKDAAKPPTGTPT